MNVEAMYSYYESEIIKIIKGASYPVEHPFNGYPNTPESMPVKMLIIIYSYTKNRSLIESFINKCNGIINKQYSFKKYLEGISELTFLYYLVISIMKSNNLQVNEFYDENKKLIDNDKRFEYSFKFDSPACTLVFEVKSLDCDPFEREKGKIKAIDGQKLIKPFFPDLKTSDFIKSHSDYIVLENSVHYNQIVRNLTRIDEKCKGGILCDEPLLIIGVMFFNASTSFEELYSYFFNSERGLYSLLKKTKLDVLVLASLDAKNDLYLDNLYNNKYIQTILPRPNEKIINICRNLRLDNFIALGDEINSFVKSKSNELYGFYKVLNRQGLLNIIPENATEEEIENYIQQIK